ncbi:MAG: hypothetical protein ACOX15_06855 [Tepidanaerobacteraceae bacterium]
MTIFSDDMITSTPIGGQLTLLYGQRAVTQQTNAGFVKYVTKIEVLTDPLEKWEAPIADP